MHIAYLVIGLFFLYDLHVYYVLTGSRYALGMHVHMYNVHAFYPLSWEYELVMQLVR